MFPWHWNWSIWTCYQIMTDGFSFNCLIRWIDIFVEFVFFCSARMSWSSYLRDQDRSVNHMDFSGISYRIKMVIARPRNIFLISVENFRCPFWSPSLEYFSVGAKARSAIRILIMKVESEEQFSFVAWDLYGGVTHIALSQWLLLPILCLLS